MAVLLAQTAAGSMSMVQHPGIRKGLLPAQLLTQLEGKAQSCVRYAYGLADQSCAQQVLCCWLQADGHSAALQMQGWGADVAALAASQ